MKTRGWILAAFLALVPLSAQASSWDYLAGGVPGHRFIFAGDLGYSALPRLSLHYGLLNRFSLGVAAQFDYSGYTYGPVGGFRPALGVSFPMRIEAYRGGRVSFGIKLEPGILFDFSTGFTFGAQLGVGFNVGVFVVDRFMVGGGLDSPIALFLVPGVSAAIPLLFGPIMEFHVSDLFALAFDLKLGPGIVPGGAVYFAMKLLFGLVFHF